MFRVEATLAKADFHVSPLPRSNQYDMNYWRKQNPS